MKLFLVFLIFSLKISLLFGQVSFGESQKINDRWKFNKGDSEQAAQKAFDDSKWRLLDLPHDWSVEGPYSPGFASATGYLPGGVAWYRKSLIIPQNRQGQKVYIYFEGIYRDGSVFVNGHFVGMRPNGYASYMYDITPWLQFGDENTIAVRVDHSKTVDSRWYTGSGIYRDVFLVYANPVHIAQWGIFFQTSIKNKNSASVNVETRISNTTAISQNVQVKQEIYDKEGRMVASSLGNVMVTPGDSNLIRQKLKVEKPLLWSLDHPNLYKLKTSVLNNEALIDETETRMGIRIFTFDADKGFALNGENMKVKGVCLHHDAGTLGSAVPKEVWKRRLINLKFLGVNAIRTSHNPQAPVFYDLCDELGLLVLNEAFDEWEFPKKKWVEGWNVGKPEFQGAYEFFEEWGETDLKDMILRDRNHPSVFMWSIGNEVDYPNDPYSHPILDQEGIQQQHVKGYQPDQPQAERLGGIAKQLAAVVRTYDPSRPVTAGLAGPVMSNETEYPGALDVVGYNYTERRYVQDHLAYPDRVLYGSENGHSYDAWKAVRDNDYIFGQFLWTGINYLGESFRWPSRGFTSGLLDLGGFIKPRGYYRRSLWCEEPMIYAGVYPLRDRHRGALIDALPLWNFENGDTLRVVAYTNCQTGRVFLNGKPAGPEMSRNEETGMITWDVVYSPGTLEIQGLNDGHMVVTDRLETTGRPFAIEARLWDKKTLFHKGDVLQIEVSIVDENGRYVYLSDDELACNVAGPAKLLGLESSDPSDMGNYNDNRQRVYRGRMIAYIKAQGLGKVEVAFSSPWLKMDKVIFEVE
jgi:hypothetical protein